MKRLLLTVILAVICVLYMATPVASRGYPIVSFQPYHGSYDDLLNGYWFDDSLQWWWNDGLPSRHTYYMPAPIHFSTRALWQSPNMIQHTAAYNGVDLSDVIDGLSLMSPADVGKTVWVRVPGGVWIRSRNADAVWREHAIYHILYNDSGLEMGYILAEQTGVLTYRTPYGGIGMPGVEVCVTEGDPHAVCAGAPVDYSTWWESNLRFAE